MRYTLCFKPRALLIFFCLFAGVVHAQSPVAVAPSRVTACNGNYTYVAGEGGEWQEWYDAAGVLIEANNIIRIAPDTSTTLMLVVGDAAGNRDTAFTLVEVPEIEPQLWVGVPIPGSTSGMGAVTCIDAQRCFVLPVGGSSVYKTTDGGYAWEVALTIPTYFEHNNNIVFPAPDTGYFCSNSGLYKTTDGGETWLPLPTTGLAGAYRLIFPSVDTGFAILTDNIVYRTLDGGLNWSPVLKAPGSFTGISFLDCADVQTCYCGGGEQGFGPGLLWKTTDGGTTWSELPPVEYSGNIIAGEVLDAGRLMIGMFDGAVLYSNDSGETWTRTEMRTGANDIRQILLLNDTAGYVVGSDRLYRTGNTGACWNRVQQFASPLYRANSLAIPAPGRGLLAAAKNDFEGMIYRLEAGPWFAIPDTICAGDVVAPENFSSVNGYQTTGWLLDGAWVTADENPSFTFNNYGHFQLSLITEKNGQPDTLNRKIFVSKPPEFLYAPMDTAFAWWSAPVELGVQVEPAEDVQIAWLRNGLVVGTGTTFQIPEFLPQNAGFYFVRLQNGCGYTEHSFLLGGIDCEDDIELDLSLLPGPAAATISWPPPFPGAIYTAYLSAGEPEIAARSFPNFRDTVLHLEDLVPYVDYQFLIGVICLDTVEFTLLNFSLGDHLQRRDGLFNRCTPRFQRPGGAPGAFYPYDVLPFTVSQDGDYFLATASPGPAGALPVGLLYEDAFDPAQPNENLSLHILAPSSQAFPQRVDSTVTLSAGKDYFLVSTRENWNEGFIDPDQSIEPRVRFWLAGPAPVQVGDIWYNGRETGPHGVVDEVDAASATDTDFMCFDTSGWAHFYRVATDPGQYAKDRLKLSLEAYPDLLEAYRIHRPVLLDGLPGASSIVNPPALYVDSADTWWVMNRFWNFPLNDPQYLQPDGPIRVRFYFTDDDYEALRNAILANGGMDFGMSEMYFYKINGLHDPFQIDPSNGHFGITAATSYDDPLGYWEYAPGPEATPSTWKYGVFSQGHYAEMVIRWLSGGGGGLSLSGGGAITATSGPDNAIPDLHVFPAPATDRLYVQSRSESTSLIAFDLYDLSGKRCLSQRFSPAMRTQVDLSTLPSAVFVLKLQAADGRIWVGKVVKQ